MVGDLLPSNFIKNIESTIYNPLKHVHIKNPFSDGSAMKFFDRINDNLAEKFQKMYGLLVPSSAINWIKSKTTFIAYFAIDVLAVFAAILLYRFYKYRKYYFSIFYNSSEVKNDYNFNENIYFKAYKIIRNC